MAIAMVLVSAMGISEAEQPSRGGRPEDFNRFESTIEAPSKSRVLHWKQGGDRQWTLYLQSRSQDGERTVTKDYPVPQRLLWAPDSLHFVMEDHESSDWQNSYVYSVPKLKRIDLGEALVKQSARLRRYKRVGSHMYLFPKRWFTADTLEVCVTGHTDSPAREFVLELRVRIRGSEDQEWAEITSGQ